jgi:hypothetical protein
MECFLSAEMLSEMARDLVETWADVSKKLKELS